MNLSPAQARQLLETLRAQEQQYLQQQSTPRRRRRPTRTNRRGNLTRLNKPVRQPTNPPNAAVRGGWAGHSKSVLLRLDSTSYSHPTLYIS